MTEPERTPQTDPPPAFLPATPGACTRFGRYEIIGELAAGGMAIVYLARVAGEAGFQRLFALKIMHEHLARDGEFVQMLLDEARVTSRLHHPNIVPILDLGKDQGRYFLAMDYIEGCSLAQLSLRHRNERDPRKLVPLVIDALEGLHAAHTLVDEEDRPLNLVHRDISPQNIMVGVDGVARVVDFGIAKAEARITSTRPGTLKGKVAFLSPEQLKGNEIDARSDIFSMGAALWSLLTGVRLFKGESESATITNILTKEVPRPSTVGLKPPACFDIICLRALQRLPSRRYQTAAAMAEDLRKVAAANGYMAPRSEIAAWIRGSFKQEFAARREALRLRLAAPSGPAGELQSNGEIGGTSGIPILPPLGRNSISGLSGVSGVAAAGTGTGSEISIVNVAGAGLTASGERESLGEVAAEVTAPLPAPSSSRKRTAIALGLGAFALVAALAVPAVLVLRGARKPAEAVAPPAAAPAALAPRPQQTPDPTPATPTATAAATPAPVADEPVRETADTAATPRRASAARSAPRAKTNLNQPPPPTPPPPKTEPAFKPPDDLAPPQ